MEKKLLRFDAFQTWQNYKELHENNIEDAEFMDTLNEALQSTILRDFNKQESGNRWRSGLAKDLYKYYKVKVDEITDEDFVKITPEDYFSQGYKKDTNVIGFFVDSNPELLKTLKEKGHKKSTGIGVITTILRGNKCMYWGFKSDPGFGRRKMSGQERYGILADEYRTKSVYGWDGTVKAKLTVTNIKEVSTDCYLLDINALKEKYGAEVRQSERAAAKKGAAAFLSNEDVKRENKSRYDSIVQAGLTPEYIFQEVRDSFDKYMSWFSKKIGEMKLDSKQEADFADVKWQGWNANIGRPITDMIRFMDDFTRDYNYAVKDLKYIAELGKKMETEKDDQKKARFQGEIEYYEKSWDRFVKKAAQKRDEVLKNKSAVDKIVG